MAAPSPIRDVLTAVGEAVRKELLRGANENGRYPLRRGSKLAQSFRAEVKQARGAGGRFAGYTADSSLTLFAEFYAVYLDRGRRPGVKKVPIRALLAFIKNRNLRGRDRKTGKFFSANQLAFMIQNAIYKKGIRGRHYLQPAFDLGQNLVDIYLNNQLLDGLTYELERTLEIAR